MTVDASRSFSTKLRELTSELRALNQSLRDNASVSGGALREFRQALDNIRLTAWTVSELQNARQIKKDTQAVVSFLTAERLRRFRQMVVDLCADVNRDGPSWPAQSVDDLQDSANDLRERLGLLTFNRSRRKNEK